MGLEKEPSITIRRYPKKSNGYYECSKCGDTFDAEYKMWDHEQTHIDEERICRTPSRSPKTISQPNTPSSISKLKRSHSEPSPLRTQSPNRQLKRQRTTPPTGGRTYLTPLNQTPIHGPDMEFTIDDNQPCTPSVKQQNLPNFQSPEKFLKQMEKSPMFPNLLQTPENSSAINKGNLSRSLRGIPTPDLLYKSNNRNREQASPLSPMVSNNENRNERPDQSPLAVPLNSTPGRQTPQTPRSVMRLREVATPLRPLQENTDNSQIMNILSTPKSVKNSEMSRIEPTQLKFLSPRVEVEDQQLQDTENGINVASQQSNSNVIISNDFSSHQTTTNIFKTPSKQSHMRLGNARNFGAKTLFGNNDQQETVSGTHPQQQSLNNSASIHTLTETQGNSNENNTGSIWDEDECMESDMILSSGGVVTNNAIITAPNNTQDPENDQDSQKEPEVPKIKMKDGVGQFPCKYCGKKFKWKSILVRHIRQHENTKPYECDQCGSRFRVYDYLARHYLIHTGEKPFPCRQCGKRFRDRSNLKQHLDTHATGKNFICEVCNHAYRNQRLVRTHKCSGAKKAGVEVEQKCLADEYGIDPNEQYNPAAGNNSPKNKGAVYCRICFHKFKNRKVLEQHLKTEHNIGVQQSGIESQPDGSGEIKPPELKEVPGLLCPICSKWIKTLHGMKLHMNRNHPETNSDDFFAVKDLVKPIFRIQHDSQAIPSELNEDISWVPDENEDKSTLGQTNDRTLIPNSIGLKDEQNKVKMKEYFQKLENDENDSGFKIQSLVAQYIKCSLCDFSVKASSTGNSLKLHYLRSHNIVIDKGQKKTRKISQKKTKKSVQMVQPLQNVHQIQSHTSSSLLQDLELSETMTSQMDKMHDSTNMQVQPLSASNLNNQNATNGFVCPICSKWLRSTSGIKQHITKIHKIKLNNHEKRQIQLPKPIFAQQNIHIKKPSMTMQKDENNCFICQVCSKRMNSLSGIRQHVVKIHGANEFYNYNENQYAAYTSVKAGYEYKSDQDIINQEVKAFQRSQPGGFLNKPNHLGVNLTDGRQYEIMMTQGNDSVANVTKQEASTNCGQPRVDNIEDKQSGVLLSRGNHMANARETGLSITLESQNSQVDVDSTPINRGPVTKEELLNKMMQDDTMLEKITAFYNGLVSSQNSSGIPSSHQSGENSVNGESYNGNVDKNNEQLNANSENLNSESENEDMEYEESLQDSEDDSEVNVAGYNNSDRSDETNDAVTTYQQSGQYNNLSQQNEHLMLSQQSEQCTDNLSQRSEQYLLSHQSVQCNNTSQQSEQYVLSQQSGQSNEFALPQSGQCNNIVSQLNGQSNEFALPQSGQCNNIVSQQSGHCNDNLLSQYESNNQHMQNTMDEPNATQMAQNKNENTIHFSDTSVYPDTNNTSKHTKESISGDNEGMMLTEDLTEESDNGEVSSNLTNTVDDENIHLNSQDSEIHPEDIDLNANETHSKFTLADLSGKLLRQYLIEHRGYAECQCGCMFQDRISLALHRRMHHFADILQCGFCDVQFESLLELFRHFINHEK